MYRIAVERQPTSSCIYVILFLCATLRDVAQINPENFVFEEIKFCEKYQVLAYTLVQEHYETKQNLQIIDATNDSIMTLLIRSYNCNFALNFILDKCNGS